MEPISSASNTEQPFPHIGNMLTDYVTKKRKYRAAMSRTLGIRLNSLLKIMKKPTIQVELLWRLSNLLKHNFVADVAMQLPSSYTGAIQDIVAVKDKEIAEIRNELFMMTRERDIYKELLMK